MTALKTKTTFLSLLIFIYFLGISEKVCANVPSAPADFVATPVSDTEVNLTWNLLDGNEKSLTIWRKLEGTYKKAAVLPARSNIFTDTSLYPSTEYTYQITADNDEGSSSPLETSATTKTSAATALAAVDFSAFSSSPYSVDLSWKDNNTMSRNWFLERSSDGGVSYSVIKIISSSGNQINYKDTTLLPSTAYYYRTRLVTGYNYSDYTSPASVMTQVEPEGAPFPPDNLKAVVDSATETILSWKDINNGGASYLIETAPFSWGELSWTQVAETNAGVEQYLLETTAEKFYYIRLRAKNSSGNSGYSRILKIRSASSGSGLPKTYEIGPGKQYESLGGFNWSFLGPGDTLKIYPNRDDDNNIIPYYEKPMISVRGTAEKPIIIKGITDETTGQKPIIDGTNAIENSQWDRSYLPIHDLALVLISYRQNQADSGWSPGYLNLENLEIRRGYGGDPGQPNTYTAFNGTKRNYGNACGIYIEKGDNIVFRDNIIHDNNEGIFGAGQGDQRNLENILVESNYLYGNGTADSSQQHNSYLEGIGIIYQFNKYDFLRSGSLGGGLKDRGAGTVVRYNWFHGGGHLLDLVESQNYQSEEVILDSYRKTYVYGNIFDNSWPGTASTPIHYGGDGGVTPAYRKGTLNFYNNTFVERSDQAQIWRVNIFSMSSGGESLDARNNILAFFPNSTQTVPEIDILSDEGVAYFGRNWINSSWSINRNGNIFKGHIAGTENFIGNAQNDPGFVSLQTGDFHLDSDSQNIDKSLVLPADFLEVQFQYGAFTEGASRSISGSALDLGAFEYGIFDSVSPSAPNGLSVR